MKTVKEVAELTGVSIRTLRYYDEIDLLKPVKLSKAGYRLYDDCSVQQLQRIMFFKELDIPLTEIKRILSNPDFNSDAALAAQKILLEAKRNRLNGLIELISDVMAGVRTMDFEAFNEEDFTKLITHSLKVTDEKLIISKFGSLTEYRSFLLAEFKKDGQLSSRFVQLYGSKSKALETSLQRSESTQSLQKQKEAINQIYAQFSLAMDTNNSALAEKAVIKLAENYKNFFKLINARRLLLELAKGYLDPSQQNQATEAQYGTGITVFIAKAILTYYGESSA
ncbi:MerR family transcriptional regulator [Enterococcus sp. LJL51]|uniref:MerR family transcriptional regulator n=1 Tax=Enterococcus sp. LJL51 TaxID=3416656 RepID=UPI003CF0428A